MTELYSILIHCRAFLKLNTTLKFTFFYYMAAKMPIPKQCRGVTYLVTLLSYFQPRNLADVYSIWLHCWKKTFLLTFWAFLYPHTLLRYTLPFSLPSFIKSESIAQVHIFLLRRWALLNLNSMLRYIPPCYFAELYFAKLIHCRTIAYLRTLLSDFAKQSQRPIRIEFYITQLHPRALGYCGVSYVSCFRISYSELKLVIDDSSTMS